MEASEKLIKAIKNKQLEDFKNQLNEIFEYVADCEARTEKAVELVKNWNRDAEIQKLQEEVLKLKSKLYNDFTITLDEQASLKEWQELHRSTKCNKNDMWSYEFTPTAIGTIGICYCCRCKDEFAFREP